MKVSAVQQQPNYSKQSVSFKAHPDFYRVSKMYPDKYNVSCFFRHGIFAVPGEEYKNIFFRLSEVFNDTSSKKSMLIGGIGDSQEPFSHLASVKSITKKPLEEVLDLYIVDIKDKPSNKILAKNSFYDGDGSVPFAQDSFTETKKYRKLLGLKPKYKINKDIFDYLKATYSRSDKSQWETRIQDAVSIIPDKKFDVISINNVLQYIEDKRVVVDTLKNIVRILKPKGLLITDTFESTRNVLMDTNKTDWLYHGIYRKK